MANDIEIKNGVCFYKPNGLRLCGIKNPIVHLTNHNTYEVHLRYILPRIKGAKCLYKKPRTWYKYDSYERAIPCSSVSVEIWDLREVVGCDKSLGEILDYEECCMLGIETEYVKVI